MRPLTDTIPPPPPKEQVLGIKGRGVFSSVLLAVDEEAPPPGEESDTGKGREVAIKVLRGNDLMLRAGLKEAALLRELMGAKEEGGEVGGWVCVWGVDYGG